uniref:WASH complex subunit 2 n=1 Tax=Mesocestoides corti TaxID=53468 RepID=A0A5K3FYR6_MESCO
QQGLTAAQIARHQHYLAIFDTLRTVTTVITNWEEIEETKEEVILDLPEMGSTVEAADAVESDDEGNEQMLQASSAQEHETSLSATLTSDLHMEETSKVLAGPGDHLDAEWDMETEPAVTSSKKP